MKTTMPETEEFLTKSQIDGQNLDLGSLPRIHGAMFEVFSPQNRIGHRGVYVATDGGAMISLYIWGGRFSGMAAHAMVDLSTPFVLADMECWPQAQYGRRREEANWGRGQRAEVRDQEKEAA